MALQMYTCWFVSSSASTLIDVGIWEKKLQNLLDNPDEYGLPLGGWGGMFC